MAIEKRKEKRIRVNLPIKILCEDNLLVLGRTENLSRLGCYVIADKEIPAGKNIEISLEFPVYTQDLNLTGKLQCKGSVFRCGLLQETESQKYYGIGIFFTDFTGLTDREKLSKYIDYLLCEEGKGINKAAALRRREKKHISEATVQTLQVMTSQEEFQAEALKLLKQILSLLEEVKNRLPRA